MVPFTSNPNCSSDLTIFIISSISSFQIINTVVPNPYIFSYIKACAADIPDNPNGNKTLLANGVCIHFSLIVN